jgi:hypothetical protein
MGRTGLVPRNILAPRKGPVVPRNAKIGSWDQVMAKRLLRSLGKQLVNPIGPIMLRAPNAVAKPTVLAVSAPKGRFYM